MLHKRLKNQIRHHRESVAICSTAGEIKYETLGLQANRVSFAIRSFYAENNPAFLRNVGLLFDGGAESIIAIIGAVFSESTYVPIHIGTPVERIVSQLAYAHISLIVSISKHAPVVMEICRKKTVKVIYLDEVTATSLQQDRDIVCESQRDTNEYLYLLHTSGSTGSPKAVMQTEENVLHFIDNFRTRIGLTSSDGILMFSNFAFDAGVVDIFSALLSGATIFPYSLHQQSGENVLREYLPAERINIWHSVPSLFRHFLAALTEGLTFPNIRILLLGGEPVRAQDIQDCRRYFPNATFGSIYGQTESSINSLWLLPPGFESYQLSTGNPVGDTQLLVADESGALVETMGVGQIVVASRHIAPGYWADQKQTDLAFSEDTDLGKLYWTGDMGRLLPGGCIEFVGRKDYQIKIRGMRVELTEIESCLLCHRGVAEAIVTCSYEEDEVLYLSCYWEGYADNLVQGSEIQHYLAKYLPIYMVPQRYLNVSEWPRHANGKINRGALPPIPNGEPGSLAPAETDREEAVLEMWKSVLQVEAVGLHTNFFDAGGNSLKLFQLQSLYAQHFGEVVPLAHFFEYPTIHAFAGFIDSADTGVYERLEGKKNRPIHRLTLRKKRLEKK